MPSRPKLRGRPTAAVAAALILIAATTLTSSTSFATETSPPDVNSTGAPEPTEQVTQLTEPGVTEGRIAVSGTGQARTMATQPVCADGAQWLRIRFTSLELNNGDSLLLQGSTGGSFTLTGKHWPGKAFYTRAFDGSCLTITPNLDHPDSHYTVDAFQAGSQPLAMATVTVAGAGDICGSACNQTDDLISDINPVSVFTAGDNAYNSGTLNEFNNQYKPTWGAFKSKTYPTPGNHEYRTSGARGYFDYFNGVGNNTGQAGERGKGYYSYDVGDWHFVAINSEISHGAGSTQERWLRADLAANTKPCTAAYTHHPRFSGGDHGDDSGMTAIFTALYDNQADLFVTGHDHHYERFAPAKPNGDIDTANGLRSFVLGTGGRGLYSSTQPTDGPSEVFNNNTFGVGKFQLSATGYTVDFVPVAGRTFTDHVTGTCHNASTGPDFGVTADPGSVSMGQGTSADSTVTVTSSGGFNSPVALSVSGLPSGVTASLAPTSVTPPSNGSRTATLTLDASATAAVGTRTITVNATSGSTTRSVNIALTVTGQGGSGFTDDFETDKGWTVNPAGTDTATTGLWERGDPQETESTYSDQIKQFGTTTSGVSALSTGRLAGSSYGANDLDNGVTSIRSPAIAVSTAASLSFQYNVAHGDNSGSNDYLRVSVMQGSTKTKVFEKLGAATEVAADWKSATVDLSAYAGTTVTLLIEAVDAGSGSLFEAQVDDLSLTGSAADASADSHDWNPRTPAGGGYGGYRVATAHRDQS